MKTLCLRVCLLACFGLCLNLTARETKVAAPAELVIHEIRYDGHLAEADARFTMTIDATANGASFLPLLTGDVAILPAKLPEGLNLARQGNSYQLQATKAGSFKFQLELVARIQRAEPWNQISFTGPQTTIAALSAETTGTNTEVQLLNGTQMENSPSNGLSRVTGFLGTDQTVALRWQGKITEVARNTLLTVTSEIHTEITPSLIKYNSTFHYNVVQGNVSRLTLSLPGTQSLTRLEGDQIRDWHTTANGDRQSLVVELIKPLESAYDLTLYSEETPVKDLAKTALAPPQPEAVERESGLITVAAEDIQLEVADITGLRQVNASDHDLAAYQFNARPFGLSVAMKQLEPVINVTDQVSARLEETRLLATHHLTLDIQKAGIYSLKLTPPAEFTITDVKGDNLDDWKMSGDSLSISFNARLLGGHSLDVQMEEALKTFPDRIELGALTVEKAAQETAQIGVAAAPGLRMKTGALAGVREIPVGDLPNHIDEILAYAAEQPDWKLSIGTERLPARVVADVFNLITIGNGIVGGSATVRYGLANQGVQEFQVRVPAQYRNVEFTGPNIRRKEMIPSAGNTNEVVWNIGLQDKAWDGYTLVVTYDYPFAPEGADLSLGGIHTLGVDRETGSVAITSAASLQINPHSLADGLHRVDESELSAADQSLITRAVVLAYQYSGNDYQLSVDVKRYAEEPVLAAVADRTQITSVLTDAGEMLTQASFMVKNNEKQFQRFELPKDAKLWGCYVDGQPAKPERDGDWVMVALPRDVDRDEAFAVDIMYAQTNSLQAKGWSKALELSAPRTDVPNTYAEWQVYAPPSLRLSDFGGSMKVTQGTTYEWLDAWEKFLTFYGQVLHEAGGAILFIGLLVLLVMALVVSAARRGWNGVITTVAVFAAMAVLGAMLLPALAAAKRKAQRISSVNNLKEIGLAVRIFAGDNTNRMPVSYEEMRDELGTDKITYDTETGERYTYLGAGLNLDSLKPESVIAYSPIYQDHCNVLYADGSVSMMSASAFGELSQRGLVQFEAGAQTRDGADQAAPVQAVAGIAATPPGMYFGYSGGGGGAGTRAINGGAAAGGAAGGTVDTLTANAVAAPATPALMGLQTPAATPTASVPTAAGIHSLRIELPASGQPFLFTKVLNIRDEPLSIRAKVTTMQSFKTKQMSWQSGLFVIGLVVWWWQWRGANRNSFFLTVALALMMGAVGSLLIEWRALHDALIIGFPMIALGTVALLVWRYWPRHLGSPAEPEPGNSPSPAQPISPASGAIPSALAAAVLLASLCAGSLSAATVTNAPVIACASYTGTINDRVALMEATFQFTGVRAGDSVALFSGDVAVQSFDAKKCNAELVRNGDRLAIKFNRNGDLTAQIKLLVKVSGDVTKRRLAFQTPPALTGQASFLLDQTEAEVDFPAAISFKQNVEQDKTRVNAVLGPDHQVELSWTPRVKRATEIAATIFCHNATAVTVGNGVIHLRATMDYQMTQGELREAQVRIPDGQHLLRVEAPGIQTWEMRNENGATILVVDLLKGVSPDWRLVVETETSLTTVPATVPLQIPHALQVKREDGLVALGSTPELALSIEATAGLERVDAAEFIRATSDNTNTFTSVFRFATTDFSLQTQVENVQPEIEAMVWNQFRVSPEQVTLTATLQYQIKRVGLFKLAVVVPEGYEVQKVNGDNIVQQAMRTDDSRRVLEVTLKERTVGNYRLTLDLARTYPALPKSLAASGVYPLGTEKLTGYVAVTAEPGVSVKTDDFNGLTEIPATAVPEFNANGSALAYQFVSSDPGAKQAWSLKVNLEAVAAWVRAEVVNSFVLSEPLITGHALIRYTIANAPVKELALKVPGQFENVEITGINVRSRVRNGNIWQVELQSPVSGTYTLEATWDEAHSNQTANVELNGISAVGVERETGVLMVSAKAPLQLTESSAVNVQKMDASDIPDWANALDATPTAVYRYVQPDYQVVLAARHFDDAEVLQALVDDAHLTSVVAEDGQMMTELTLSVRDNGMQFLEIELPANASVWSASVGGQAVRPSKRDGKLLLPIESTGNDSAVTVDLTYVSTNTFPGTKGDLGFVSPTFAVPLKNAHWDFYLPQNFNYQNFEGTMSREVMTASEAPAARFSKLDYSRREKAGKVSGEAEIKREMSEARQRLTSGDVRDATASFNRAWFKTSSGLAADKDMVSLADDLKKAQASNLINAQNFFSERNGAVDAPANQPIHGNLMGHNGYDDVAAGEQWSKLQQAQEVVTAKVQPLRVNLPIHGLHYAFTQVLQTEGGKPMTVNIFAISNQLVNWPARLLVGAVVFLGLWLLVIGLSRVSLHRAAN